MLFNKRLLQTHLNSFDYPSDYDYERAQHTISLWQKSIRNGNYDKTKETQIQSMFLTKFFNEILGFIEMLEGSDEWFLVNEAKTEVDSTRADGALGFYTKEHNNDITRAVIELKDANTPLDKKQSSRKDYDSPVSQAFSYSSKFDRCDWVIVSNFKEIRLYNKDRGQGYYESFEVLNLDDEKEFKRFYFCLCRQNLLDKDRNSLLDNLVKDTSRNEEEISKDFYKDFKALRKSLFEHICENNPEIDKKCVLEKTQKLLDRLVFIMFCEDSAIGLLPPLTLKNYYETGKNLPIPSDTKIWDIIKGLFQSIDKGNLDINPPINKYNGGLFSPDEILENLKIKDSAWADVVDLAGYDFESDLNVNILGHIFEQSLSDLEQIKAEIDGVEQDSKKSKRKKDGIFYTPEYITRYIVEQTIGKYLEENPDKLETIKILDPACGSGAFLNQAHSFLQQQYKIRTEERINATRLNNRAKGQEVTALNLFEHSNIADTNRSILLNNLYGVDLNSESTEITKLALWLKTAQKDQPLQNLDKNIKCGNSLIDDKTIAGDKAFNWNEEFKDIMTNGGFDVIIGNPPYFNIDTFGHGSPIFEHLKTAYSDIYMDKSDILFYFIKKSIDLLKDNGILGFIISNAFLFSDKAVKLRNYILANTSILKIVNFEQYNVFKDAGITTCILILQKNKNSDTCKVINIKEKDLTEEVVMSKIQDIANSFDVCFEHDKPFALVDCNISILNEKIDGNHQKLGQILHIGKGMETAADNVFLFETYPKQFPDKFIKKRISGENINRYWINTEPKYILYFEDVEKFEDLPLSIQNYLLENKAFLENRATVKNEGRVWWRYSRPMHKELYHTDKLYCSRRSKSNIFCYETNFEYLGFSNMTVIFDTNKFFSLKYILSLLNSKVLNYRYKSLGKQTGGGSFEYFPNGVAKLPIPHEEYQTAITEFNNNIAAQEQQQNLAQKAEQMIELNKKLHEGINSALELIKSEYQPKKISQNLEKFYTLGIHPFLEELEKQKVKLSLNQKEELINWYKDKSEQLTKIKQQIDTLDHLIDQEVYKLYNLTDEEIKIVESAQ